MCCACGACAALWRRRARIITVGLHYQKKGVDKRWRRCYNTKCIGARTAAKPVTTPFRVVRQSRCSKCELLWRLFLPPSIRVPVPLVGTERRVNGADRVQRGGQNHTEPAVVSSGIQNTHGGARCRSKGRRDFATHWRGLCGAFGVWGLNTRPTDRIQSVSPAGGRLFPAHSLPYYIILFIMFL